MLCKRIILVMGLIVLGGFLSVWIESSADGQQPHPVVCRDPRVPISSLPFTIDTCGSYFLTDCLTGVAGDNGITVTVSDVTLDLNGFSLIGVPGSFDGIATVGTLSNITILNGGVRNWGGDGIDAWTPTMTEARNSRYQSVTAHGNGANGFNVGDTSTVTSCIATENADTGINARDNCVITRCQVRGTFANQDGIVALGDSVIVDSISRNNGVDGFRVSAGARISGCSANQNNHNGFTLEGESSCLSHCIARSNGTDQSDGAGIVVVGGVSRVLHCTAKDNDGDGIRADGAACLVDKCIAVNNGADGIQGSSDSTITNNTCDGNPVGIHLDVSNSVRIEGNSVTDNTIAGILIQNTAPPGNLVIRNIASNSTVGGLDYSVTPNDTVGPIIIGPQDPITSNNPWANLSL